MRNNWRRELTGEKRDIGYTITCMIMRMLDYVDMDIYHVDSRRGYMD